MTRALQWLAEAERRWGERPEAPPDDWLPPAPTWLERRPEHLRARADAPALWKSGSVQWARVLMANEAIWRPGIEATGGELLWSEDPFFQRFPDALEGAADAYWALKQGDTQAAGLRALQAFARDELRDFGVRRFPPLISGGRVIWHVTLVVYRAHLPGGRLLDRLVPIVRARSGSPPLVMVLPGAFWPAALAAEWERRAGA